MNQTSRMEITQCYISNLIVVLLICSMVTTLITIGISQKFFYCAAYLSILTYLPPLASKMSNPARIPWELILALVMLGVVKYTWFLIEHSALSNMEALVSSFNNLRNYQLDGKKLLAGASLLASMTINRHLINKQIREIGLVVLVVGIVIIALIGAYEYYFNQQQRVKWMADGASSASYMVLFAYCGILALLNNKIGWVYKLFFMMSTIFTTIALICCNTRVSIVAFCCLLATFALQRYWGAKVFSNMKVLLVLLATILLLFFATSSRWQEGIKDIQAYKQNSSTSLGARVVIWESGFHFASNHLGYSSPEDRTIATREYMTREGINNPEAYTNTQYNMHNEFLEAASLQGILGLITLIYFYLSFLLCYRKKTTPIEMFYPVIVFFVCGLTDSVLVNSQTTMMGITAMVLAQIATNRKAADQLVTHLREQVNYNN